MVTDKIERAALYYGLGDRIKLALEYLKNNNFSGVEPGRYDIDGDKVYALVQSYDTIPEESGKWEAHKKYIDIQFVASGAELIGYSDIGGRAVLENYDESNDIMFLESGKSHIAVNDGSFVILWPHDAHLPRISEAAPRAVKKVVVKVFAG